VYSVGSRTPSEEANLRGKCGARRQCAILRGSAHCKIVQGHCRELCKNGRTDRDGVLSVDSGGPRNKDGGSRNHDGVQIPYGKGQLWGKEAAHCKVQGRSAVSLQKRLN